MRKWESQQEPVRAWKIAWIIHTKSYQRGRADWEWVFCGVGSGGIYRAVDAARCDKTLMILPDWLSVSREHMVRCQCGFYGLKRGVSLPQVGMGDFKYHAVLDVELYGSVIQHQLGYRATHQRILGARIIRPWGLGLSA